MPPDDEDLPRIGQTGERSARAGTGGIGTWIAIAAGLVLGAALAFYGVRQDRFADLPDAEIGIRVNGLGPRIGRDVLVPKSGWTLQIDLPEGLSPTVRASLVVTLREERTGATIEITDRFAFEGLTGSFVVPESVGLIEGLFSIRAQLVDEAGHELVAFRRQRIRGWLGGPPIGSQQVIHFDFSVDRDGDARPDFEQDLERWGWLDAGAPALATPIARALAEQALRRVRAAYDGPGDPNLSGQTPDPVRVHFVIDPVDTPFATRICVGGVNERFPESIGNVRFDPENSRRGDTACQPRDADRAPEGLFPAELTIYRDDPLYRAVTAPFDAAAGGRPVGSLPGDDLLLAEQAGSERGRALAEAITVFGDALGSVLAHESAHALGLVPEGKPSAGLFGGRESEGGHYAHNRSTEGDAPAALWLMNTGTTFRFEDLAGRGEVGALRFRPLNHAYLRDRVILKPRP